MSRKLRKQQRISYYEPEEPNLDEYVFCKECADYVYEYCAIHGPLLVVPDDKVPAVSPFPPCVPRAALTIPSVFLHIAPSRIPGAGLGIFTTLAMPEGVRFGPYVGKVTKVIDSDYCWQIYDSKRTAVHVIDAADPNSSNWMRYVNCARHSREQNLVPYQYQGQIYYRTIRIIPRYTELLVYYGAEYARRIGIDPRRYNAPYVWLPYVKPIPKKTITEETKDSSSNEVKVKEIDVPIEVPLGDKTHNSKIIKPDKQITIKIPEIKKSIKIVSKSEMKKEVISTLTEDKVNNNSSSMNNRNKTVKNYISDKKFKCDFCPYSSDLQTNSLRHERTHTGEKPYSCSVCEYKCTTSSHLKRHSRVHTGEKPYTCNVCQKRFIQMGGLKTHARVHTGEKPYSCSVCQYKCTTSSSLKTHARIHTGDKPYTCNVCQKRFIQMCNLKTHARTHTGQKAYKCSVCEYKCSDSSSFKKHLRKHIGEKS